MMVISPNPLVVDGSLVSPPFPVLPVLTGFIKVVVLNPFGFKAPFIGL